MESYTIIQWLFFFYLYCFLGWCVESAYVSICSRKLTNRGFLRGPFLPLYGSGAIMMLVVSMPFRDNLFLVYLSGCVGATILEYITGVVMEKLFKVRYWDYSNQRFNFRGYICLGTTLSWGFLTVLMTEFLHVQIEKLLFLLPERLVSAATILLTVFLTADFVLSFKAAIDLRDLMVKMAKAKEELQAIQKRLDAIITSAGENIGSCREALVESMDELKLGIEGKLESLKTLGASRPSAYLESVKEELSELKTKYAVNVEMTKRLGVLRDFFQRHQLKGNPGMTSESYPEALEELKRQARQRKREKKGTEQEQ